jgi:hypothetical protein
VRFVVSPLTRLIDSVELGNPETLNTLSRMYEREGKAMARVWRQNYG